MDHVFDYEEQDLFGTTIYYNADNAVVYDVPEAMQAKPIIFFERFATYDAESTLRNYAGTQRMVVLTESFAPEESFQASKLRQYIANCSIVDKVRLPGTTKPGLPWWQSFQDD